MDGITITGVRAAESIQRARNIAAMTMTGKNMTNRHQVLPIYDWSNNDVWLYLLENKVEIPDIYLYLWQAGTAKGQLRVSQFFSVDTARSLVKMNEYYPDLMERVIRREPNAYLAALYWDSEMFGRTSKTRRELEKGAEKDYRAMLVDVFNKIDTIFGTAHQKYIAKDKLAVYGTVRTERKRAFDTPEEKELYLEMVKKKVEKGERLPGQEYTTQTTTEGAYSIILKLEEALTRCQAQKQRAIDSLNKIRQAQGSKGGALTDDWISGVVGSMEMEDDMDD